MIGLYYKEGIKWIKWTSKYDYLVTRYKIVYHFGKVLENVKNDYLTGEGVDAILLNVNLLPSFFERENV